MTDRGTFSLHFSEPEKCGTAALDWELCGRRWSTSFREHYSVSWELSDIFDQKAYAWLLERFGLEQWQHELPIHRVLTMSPKELILERRTREEKFGMPRIDVISDTTCFHVLAEEVD